MILLDSDILLLDQRYQRDPRFGLNRQTLQELSSRNEPIGISLQALLEVVGILSFNVTPADIPLLPKILQGYYRLSVLPDLQPTASYAGCLVNELIHQIQFQMSLGDAVQAVQIARFANNAQCLLSWNAKHFSGKLAIPVFTPEEWLRHQNKP